MGLHWTTGIDAGTAGRRAHLARLQARARRRAYWGADGYAWAYVRAGAYVVAVVAVAVIVTVVLAG